MFIPLLPTGASLLRYLFPRPPTLSLPRPPGPLPPRHWGPPCLVTHCPVQALSFSSCSHLSISAWTSFSNPQSLGWHLAGIS